MKYVNAHIPSRIESKTSWKHINALTTKSFQDFINKKEKFKFIVFDMKLFRKFKL
jgi:hypothetical protein